MPDTLDLTYAITQALTEFRFSSYGCDDIDEIMDDSDLDLKRALVSHLVKAIQKENWTTNEGATGSSWPRFFRG